MHFEIHVRQSHHLAMHNKAVIVPAVLGYPVLLLNTFQRHDVCNSILTGTTTEISNRLQSIQNYAARLIAKIRNHEHINLILIEVRRLYSNTDIHT